MKTIISQILAFTLVAFAFISCDYNKDEEIDNGKTRLEILVNTTSSAYDAINIDIEGLFINATDDLNSGWRRINLLKKGVCNLLELQNGIDMMLAGEDVASGSIRQIRLVLASNNSVVKNGVPYSIDVPLLIMNVDKELVPGETCKFLIDFNVEKSTENNVSEGFLLQAAMHVE